jgi:hypothetical protein
MLKILLFFSILIYLMPGIANAQTWEIGGTVGASGYMGDFNPTNPLKFTDVALGGFVKRNFNGFVSAKVGYMHGNIQGDDSQSSSAQMRNRNLNFNTSLDEVSLIGELNFIRYIPEVGRNKFTPFIFAGIGGVGYDPKTQLNGTEYRLRPQVTEGPASAYSGRAFAIPYGAGIKYNFSGKWNLIVDLGYRNPNTPYLDDVYGVYPDPATLPSDLSRSLSDRSAVKNMPYTQRGNFRSTDTYMFAGFTVSYTFVPLNCPLF